MLPCSVTITIVTHHHRLVTDVHWWSVVLNGPCHHVPSPLPLSYTIIDWSLMSTGGQMSLMVHVTITYQTFPHHNYNIKSLSLLQFEVQPPKRAQSLSPSHVRMQSHSSTLYILYISHPHSKSLITQHTHKDM